MKNFGLNFQKCPVMNGTVFSRISGKEDNQKFEIFGNFLLEISLPFDSVSSRFWLNSALLEISGNFPEKKVATEG